MSRRYPPVTADRTARAWVRFVALVVALLLVLAGLSLWRGFH